MADQKISELTALTGANVADDDAIAIVDTSATETKKIVFSELKNALDTATGFVRITGDTMTGDLALSGADATFGDNDKAIFGAGSDLQIYHDGSNSYIDDAGAGILYVRSNGAGITLRTSTNEQMVTALNDGAVNLFYDNSQKLATTATGIDVTGTVTADGLTVDGDATIQNTGNSYRTFTIGANRSASVNTLGRLDYDWDGTPVARIHAISGTDATNKDNGDLVLSTSADGTLKQRIFIDQGGDISFYEDTGTTPKMVWKSADERLGIGTSSPNQPLTVVTNSSAQGINITGRSSDDRAYMFFSDNNGTTYRGSIHTIPVDNRFNINAYSGENITFSNNGAEKVRIDSSGNVGIGESNPDGRIDISVSGTNERIHTVRPAGGGGSPQFGFKFRWGDDADSPEIGLLHGGSYADAGLYFDTMSGGSKVSAMRINSSGNIGIGTDSPDTDLHVEADTPVFRLTNPQSTSSLGLSMGKIEWETRDSSAAGVIAHIDVVDSNNFGTTFDMAFATGQSGSATERMRIDASGNVGIGATTITEKLEVAGDIRVQNAVKFRADDDAENGSISLSDSDELRLASFGTAGHVTVNTGSSNTERMRIDSSGNLLVGKTSLGFATDGFEARASGQIYITDTTATPLVVRRNSTDGDIVNFYKDGATVGSIGISYGDRINVGTGNTGIMFRTSSRSIDPADPSTGLITDNLISLGRSGVTYKDLHLSGTGYVGTSLGIGTSDPVENLTVGATTTAAGFSLGSATTQAYLRYNNYFSGTSQVSDATKGSASISLGRSSDGVITFNTAAAGAGTPTEAARFDNSGDLLVGTTSTILDSEENEEQGVDIRPEGFVKISRSGNHPLQLARTDAGELIKFRSNEVTVGSIGTDSGFTYYTGGSGSGVKMKNAAVVPTSGSGVDADGTESLGQAAARWNNLYLSGGVYLGGTGAANLLDDYEEGVSNPTLSGGVSGTHAGYGTYAKAGSLVLYQFTFNAIGSGLSGALTFGLPFTNQASNNTGQVYFPVQVYNADWRSDAKALYGYVSYNSTSVSLFWSRDDNTSISMQGSEVDATNCYIRGTIMYRTDS